MALEERYKLTDYQIEGIEKFFAQVGSGLKAVDDLLLQEPPEKPVRIHDAWIQELYRQWQNPGFLFAWSMGAGKTLASLTICNRWPDFVDGLGLKSEKLCERLHAPILIEGPASNRFVWDKEGAKHGVPLIAEVPETDLDFTRAAKHIDRGYAEALVASYTGVARNVEKLLNLKFSLGIFDEAHKLGNTQTATSQAVYGIARLREDGIPGIPVRLGLTGTPFLNHIDQIWPVLSFLNGWQVQVNRSDEKRQFLLRSDESYWGTSEDFARNYTEQVGSFYGSRGKVVGRNLFHDPLANHACRYHDADECNCLHNRMVRKSVHRVTQAQAEAGIPESPAPEWVHVPMNSMQKRLYQHLVSHASIPLNTGSIGVSRLALLTYGFEIEASTGQLLQSLQKRDNQNKLELEISGFDWSKSDSAKADYIFEDWLPNLDAPALIGTKFALFAKELFEDPRMREYNPLLLAGTGNMTAPEFETRMNSGKHKVGICTTMGATGLNIQAAKFVLVAGFYDWSPLIVAQFIGRAKRKGQTSKVITTCLYDQFSLEGWLQGKLKTKIENSAAVMDGRGDGAEDLGLGHMSQADFLSIFSGGL